MRYLSFLIIAMLALSCVKVTDLPGPAFQKKVVLLGLLHPDSLLSVQLLFNHAIGDTLPYQYITNAKIIFKKNGQVLGAGTYTNTGQYVLKTKPEPNYNYQVEAEIPNYGNVTASEFLPKLPVFYTEVDSIDRQRTAPYSNSPNITLHFQNILNLAEMLWINVFYSTLRFNSKPKECYNTSAPPEYCDDKYYTFVSTEHGGLYAKLPAFDNVTGGFDNFWNTYSYDNPARLLPQYQIEKDKSIQFSLKGGYSVENATDPKKGTYLFIFSAGPAFDKYLKTVIVAQKNELVDKDGKLSNPFATPLPVYTNVVNGLGIWGAQNSRYVKLKLNSIIR